MQIPKPRWFRWHARHVRLSIGKPPQPAAHSPSPAAISSPANAGQSRRPARQSDRPLNRIPPTIFLARFGYNKAPTTVRPMATRNEWPAAVWEVGFRSCPDFGALRAVAAHLDPGPVCEHRRAELLVAGTSARFPGIRPRLGPAPWRVGRPCQTARHHLSVPRQHGTLPHAPAAVEHGVARAPSAPRGRGRSGADGGLP